MILAPRPKIGDIIVIPLDEISIACAQVLERRKIIYLGIFGSLYKSMPPPGLITEDKIILAGWTMDAKIHTNKWKILYNKECVMWPGIKKDYLVEFDGAKWVQDFNGNLKHIASFEEISLLFPKSSYSPVRLERAVRAYHGLEAWSSEFDDLIVHPLRA